MFLLGKIEDRPLGIVNTHLKWDQPGMPREEQWGYREAVEVMQKIKQLESLSDSWIITGDFNVQQTSDVLTVFRQSGFLDTYEKRPDMFTCNSNKIPKRIDYLLHTHALKSVWIDLPTITANTILPYEDEPSDHLMVIGQYVWV